MTAPEEAPSGRDPLRFLPGVAEQLRWYVYALHDPRDGGTIFYVGKGVGDRVYQHAVRAKAIGDEGGGRGVKFAIIREIHGAGLEVGVEIIRHDIADQERALEIEAAVIDALRLAGVELSNLVRGHGTDKGWRPLEDLVAKYHARPVEIPPEERVVLIRIKQLYRSTMTDAELYEVTRKWWRKGARRKPEWAFAVYNGIVRAVYRIEGPWYHPSQDEADERIRTRKAFDGVRDEDMESRYYLRDVSAYMQKSQAPLRYVNC